MTANEISIFLKGVGGKRFNFERRTAEEFWFIPENETVLFDQDSDIVHRFHGNAR